MATNAAAITADLIEEFKAKGFDTENDFAKNKDLAEAIGKVIYKHMQLLDDKSGNPASQGHQ